MPVSSERKTSFLQKGTSQKKVFRSAYRESQIRISCSAVFSDSKVPYFGITQRQLHDLHIPLGSDVRGGKGSVGRAWCLIQ